MRLKHFEYIKLVREAYKKKRASNEQPLLVHSTPGKIRRECLNVYRERYHKKDEQTLRAFFGPAEPGRQFLQAISTFETDRFKPLDNYLKGITENTDDANLELLAWLIDFQHRPFSFDNNVILSEEESALIDNPVEARQETAVGDLQNKKGEPAERLKNEGEEESGKHKIESSIASGAVANNTKGKSKLTMPTLIFLILVIGAGGMYTIITGNTNTNCMYWAGDHYESVPCNEEANGRLILPLNRKRMEQFKRITREDTITWRSIGKIYYIKDSNKIEYYTEGGRYPEDVNRSLKKLSRYIFEKDSVNRIPK